MPPWGGYMEGRMLVYNEAEITTSKRLLEDGELFDRVADNPDYTGFELAKDSYGRARDQQKLRQKRLSRQKWQRRGSPLKYGADISRHHRARHLGDRSDAPHWAANRPDAGEYPPGPSPHP
ncbi:hypothetical protein BP00DRAFT_452502 [Aspergillus indologenus CBS 114.80]|uniref:Uncharacterized protein n=1 Tax=Aspergillus indologenus CBS 114.80 TaxID=1450541 RepID=A0A2V5IXI3_9EURO|nr:hypothetical protein BP00DRAFT_452502 [Aspergillus indologenus CBS 114.80]